MDEEIEFTSSEDASDKDDEIFMESSEEDAETTTDDDNEVDDEILPIVSSPVVWGTKFPKLKKRKSCNVIKQKPGPRFSQFENKIELFDYFFKEIKKIILLYTNIKGKLKVC